MKVVIVAKTRQGSGACIGGITFNGYSVRLIAADRDTNERFNIEYHVGDVWDVDYVPDDNIVPPHVENIVVQRKRRLPPLNNIIAFIERHMPPREGSLDALYEGLTQATGTDALYVAERTGFPPYSTMFWRPDQPLTRDEDAKRIRYRYPIDDGGRTLTFVGFQEPVTEIPAGTLLRVSLAHQWRPPDRPDQELRCYVQLSGWFTDGDWGLADVPSVDGTSATGDWESPVANLPPITNRQPPPDGDARTTLRQVFGFDSFRPMQAEVIDNVLQKRDTLAVMPTGSGKSLCFQLPALLFPGLTVVVSPLISLMQDQVEQLRELGIAAVTLNSTISYHEYLQATAQIKAGAVELLYVAPETLLRPETLVMLEGCRVDCLTIDEAHCISEWGHDFRPEYRQLVGVRHRLPGAVCIAVTATATQRVRQDIKSSLAIADAGEFIASFNRENLFLAVQLKTDGLAQTLGFLEAHRDQSGIIYCTTRRQVDELAAELAGRGWPVLPYHAGLDDKTRHHHQRQFSHDKVPIIVATIAFGMGINKSNVRFVLHYNLPKNLESYYQEIGRSGRDGLRADCLLLFSYGDVQTINYFIQQQEPSQQQGALLRLQALLRFAETNLCRRQPLLTYFGEPYTAESCDMCDNCLVEEQDLIDLTVPAQKFLSCVKRTGEIFGVNYIIDVLRGSQSKRVLQRGHDRLSTYGIGRDFSKKEWQHLARQFIEQGLLTQDMEHGSLRLTAKAYAVFKGEPVMGLLPEQRAQIARPRAYPVHDPALFETLRAKRHELATASNIPPYVIFSDRSLVEMATYFPQSRAAFGTIYGVGEAKLAKYADHFLPLIREYCQANQMAEKPKPAGAPFGSSQRLFSGVKSRTAEIAEAYNAGQSVPDITKAMGIKQSTVVNHLWKHVQAGQPLRSEGILELSKLPPLDQQRVLTAFAELGADYLRPIYEALEEKVSYDELHVLRLYFTLTQASSEVTHDPIRQREIQRVILSCVRSMPGELPRSGIAKLLIGSESQRVATFSSHPDFGRLSHLRRHAVMLEIDALLASGRLVLDENRQVVLSDTGH
ncbi:MAG TPA: DNA helicase RecQ [Anaerolineae bacterium]